MSSDSKGLETLVQTSAGKCCLCDNYFIKYQLVKTPVH